MHVQGAGRACGSVSHTNHTNHVIVLKVTRFGTLLLTAVPPVPQRHYVGYETMVKTGNSIIAWRQAYLCVIIQPMNIKLTILLGGKKEFNLLRRENHVGRKTLSQGPQVWISILHFQDSMELWWTPSGGQGLKMIRIKVVQVKEVHRSPVQTPSAFLIRKLKVGSPRILGRTHRRTLGVQSREINIQKHMNN